MGHSAPTPTPRSWPRWKTCWRSISGRTIRTAPSSAWTRPQATDRGDRVPIPAKPGRPARHDYEYERNGTANLFMLFAPLEGWRHVEVTDRHAAVDYAHLLRDLSDTHFSNVPKIALVQDNLSTHKPASLYEAFPAARGSPARRAVRVALHPKARQLAGHGRSPNSACCPPSASIGASPTSRP